MSGYFKGLVAGTAGARIRPSVSRFAIAAGQPEVDEIELPARFEAPAGEAAPSPAPARPSALPVPPPRPDPAPSRWATAPPDMAAVRHTSPAVVESVRRGAVPHSYAAAADPPTVRSMRPFQRAGAAAAGDAAPVIEPRHAAPPPSRRSHQDSTAVSRAAESTSGAVDQPPDVHIHIGRIELTAVAPPAAPRRPPSPPMKPALPLDEYLQRRNRRSR